MSYLSGNSITVIKQDSSGMETWRYNGEIIQRSATKIEIEAYFDRDDMLFNGIWLRKGDRFIETYFTERWYNIFEILDVNNNISKGWYCNIATPAVIEETTISYNDLALDLMVFPDGRQLVLDEDEFEALNLSDNLVARAKAALVELQELFHSHPNDGTPIE